MVAVPAVHSLQVVSAEEQVVRASSVGVVALVPRLQPEMESEVEVLVATMASQSAEQVGANLAAVVASRLYWEPAQEVLVANPEAQMEDRS